MCIAAVVITASALPVAAQDDVLLITDFDIEALLEQELDNLNVDDFYLLEHLIDIDTQVQDQQTQMDAVRDEANRIFETFGVIETQMLLDQQQSGTVLDKAFEKVVRTYATREERRINEVPLLLDAPQDVLLGAATRGNLDDAKEIKPAAAFQAPEFWERTEPELQIPSVLVLLLEELERSQSSQAELRETLRDEIVALGAQLENIEEHINPVTAHFQKIVYFRKI